MTFDTTAYTTAIVNAKSAQTEYDVAFAAHITTPNRETFKAKMVALERLGAMRTEVVKHRNRMISFYEN